MIAKTLTIATIAATVLCGCTPDDTKVTVNASALKAAVDAWTTEKIGAGK